MVVSNLTQGGVTAVVSVLYAFSALSFSLLILLVLALYSAAQFYRAATNAIVPRVVTKENLGAANGLFSLSTSANQLVGYSLGGIVILVLGPDVPITYDSLTFFVAAALLTMIAKSYGRPTSVPPPAVEPTTSFWKDFREGLGYVRQSRIFLELILFGLIVNFFASAVFALIAPYAKLWLHGDASTYGFLASSFALGTIVGSVTVGKVDFRSYVGKLLFLGVMAFGVVLALVGLVSFVPLAFAAFVSMGLILAWVNVPINALLQTKIPGKLLGRASTVLVALVSGAQPVAAVLSGTLAVFFSIGSVFFASGVAIVITSLILYPLFGELRRAEY
jgi:MFS family permease